MFRHGNDLYVVGRTDPRSFFMSGWTQIFPNWLSHLLDLALYSLRPHGAALWKLDVQNQKLVLVADLPGCGDTAFPSIERISKHKYLIANFSSHQTKGHAWSLLRSQLAPEGSSIYLIELDFEKQKEMNLD